MNTSIIIGAALLMAGLMEIVLGMVLVGPRIPDEQRRGVVQKATLFGGLVVMILGILFLTGVVG